MSMDQERRVGPARTSISTLVDIGAGEDGAASFEAEAVDITTAGMRLSTAYLPEENEPVVCRFEGRGGEEIIVQGEVAWRNEEAMGGEFGVRFTEIDQASLDALHNLVGTPQIAHADDAEQDELAEEPAAPTIARGDRINLIVDDAVKPMKAFVHDATHSDVILSRRLDMLAIDEQMQVEQAETGERRPARIERVSVQVDPETKIPSLIIAMRYLDVMGAAHEDDDNQMDDSDGQRQTLVSEDSVQVADDESYEDEAEATEGPAAIAWSKLKEAGPKLAALGEVAKKFGGKAKDVVVETVGKAKNRTSSDESSKDSESSKPRRTTAPPPKGALRVNGSRSERVSAHDHNDHQEQETDEEPTPRKKLPKKAVVIALSVLMVAIVSIAVARKSTGTKDTPQVAQRTAAEEGLANPPGAQPTTEDGLQAPPTGALVANVPLFGPTPITAGANPAQPSEAMQPGAGLASAGGATPPPAVQDGNKAAQGAGAAAAAVEDDEALEGDEPVASSDKTDDSTEEETVERQDPKAHKTNSRTASHRTKRKAPKSFGRGKLRHPVVYTIRMSRNIRGLKGSANSRGFTVVVEGARAKQGAAPIRRKDRRVAKASIVNRGKNARLTIRFKDKAPGYRVQARGRTLRIILSGNRRTANSKHHSGKRHR